MNAALRMKRLIRAAGVPREPADKDAVRNAKLCQPTRMRIIQVRSSREPRWQKQGGWEVFEAEGVCPVYCGPNGRGQALSYARQRAGYGRAEIPVLDQSGNVAETIQRGIAAIGLKNVKPEI